MLDVSRWLAEQGLGHHAQAFAANGIAGDVLRELTDADLKELGLNLGDRKRLLKAITALNAPAALDRLERGGATTPVLPREAERRQLTVMIVDLVGSTELAARLDPEDMSALIRAYQNAVAGEITRFEGHVAKYMGDGVLAYFGYPVAHEEEAERAVRAGLAIVKALAGLRTPSGEPLAARIGIATGSVVVGELIGEGAAQEQAVVGETPNRAARLQSLAEPGRVVISQATRRLVGSLFELADLGPQHLKGFAEPVRAWRVVGIGAAENRFEAMHVAGLTPLVGREHELALLLERWERAKDGEGQVVLLSGEPGIGKSRLAQALHERLAAEPQTRLRYHCSPYHVNSALFPVIDHLERAARCRPDDTAQTRLDKLEAVLAETTENLTEVVPLLAALLMISTEGRYPPLELTPEAQKARTFEALMRQVAALAERRPVLMVLEDALWIDPTSAELFGLLIDRIQRLPVLLLVTFRPEFSPPWTGHGHVTSLTLCRLGRRQGAAMIERLTDSKALPAEVLSQILAKTDGVPLFVEELTKTVLESGLLADAGDHFELSGSLPPLAIPATLHGSLMARLDRLAPVKEVAQIGAVVGREFSYELLAAVAAISADRLGDSLEQLVSSELVFRRGNGPDATYAFKHALVQEVAYQSLLKSKRQQLHARIAEVLEAQFPETVEGQPDLLAHHCTEAGLAEQAAAFWYRAGQQALARSALAEAATHLTKGLEVLAELPGEPERQRRELPLQVALGSVLIATKGFTAPETERAYARAHELCLQTGATAQLLQALFGRFAVHFQRGELDTAHEIARKLLRVADEQGDIAGQVVSYRTAGAVLFQLGQLVESRTHLERGLARYDLQRDRSTGSIYAIDSRVVCLHWLSQGLLTLGHPDQARVRAEEALAWAHEIAHPSSIAHALCGLSFTYQRLGRRREADAESERLMAFAGEQGFPLWGAAGLAIHGWALADDGRSKEGIEEIQRGLADYIATGAGLWLPDFLALNAEAHRLAGRPEAGLGLVADALRNVAEGGRRWIEPELHRMQGELLLPRPDVGTKEAEACFRHAVARARQDSARMLELRAATSLARLWAEQGRRTEAHELLEPIYGWFAEGFDTPDLMQAKALLDELA